MNHLRPDEIASESNVRRAKERDISYKKGAKTALALGTTAIAGGLASRIVPFLSEHIPIDLALKGISKVSPRLGQFLDQGMKSGLNVKDGLDYIKDNLSSRKNEPAKENRNIIQQYSDELDAFIKEQIQSGRNPIEAGALAQMNGKFKNVIKKLETDHKTPFSAILQTAYGEAQQPEIARQEALGKFNQRIKKPTLREELAQQFEQEYGAQQQPGQDQGSIDQTLMAALQKILQM